MHLTITFTPPIEDKAAKFQRLADTGIYESIGRLAGEIDDIMLAALVDEAPKRTGEYASAIHSAQLAHGGGGLTLEYRAPDPLSTWIIGGTAPHVIEPTTPNGVLRFLAASGDIVFAKHVSHPGTQPNDYPQRAWQNARGEVIDVWSRIGGDLASQVV